MSRKPGLFTLVSFLVIVTMLFSRTLPLRFVGGSLSTNFSKSSLDYLSAHETTIWVPDNYTTIQDAINAAKEGDTIRVKAGTYLEWALQIEKDNLSLIGENKSTTIIDGRNRGWILTVKARNVTISGFTIQKSSIGTAGIFLELSTGSRIKNNILRSHDSGIYSVYSNSNVIENNWVSESYAGIILSSFCKDNKISDNYVFGNTRGIDLSNHANHNNVENNKIGQNTYGISISLDNNSIIGNQIINNHVGIYEDLEYGPTQEYTIFRNNLVNNTKQLDLGSQSVHVWDDGLEGNYWSNYNGTDFNHDGIGDTSNRINERNTDNYPLMGMFSSFNTSYGYYANVISNSTLETFQHFRSNNTIKMHVSNMTSKQTFGFCRVYVPKDLIYPPYTVVIDDGLTEVLYFNGTLYDNGTYRWIYFAYQHSTHDVAIQGFPPPDTSPPLISIISPKNTVYSTNDVPLTFTVNESTSWIGYSSDGKMNVTITGNTTLYGLLNGVHSLTVYARDNAWNTGASETIYFMINTQQPEPFPIWVVAAIVTLAGVGAALLVYFAKIRKTAKKK